MDSDLIHKLEKYESKLNSLTTDHKKDESYVKNYNINDIIVYNIGEEHDSKFIYKIVKDVYKKIELKKNNIIYEEENEEENEKVDIETEEIFSGNKTAITYFRNLETTNFKDSIKFYHSDCRHTSAIIDIFFELYYLDNSNYNKYIREFIDIFINFMNHDFETRLETFCNKLTKWTIKNNVVITKKLYLEFSNIRNLAIKAARSQHMLITYFTDNKDKLIQKYVSGIDILDDEDVAENLILYKTNNISDTGLLGDFISDTNPIFSILIEIPAILLLINELTTQHDKPENIILAHGLEHAHIIDEFIIYITTMGYIAGYDILEDF